VHAVAAHVSESVSSPAKTPGDVKEQAKGILSEVASNHHSNYPHTIGAIGGTIFGGLAYLIMIRVMRRLP